MSGKAFAGGTVIGGIVSFLVGWLFWGLALGDFYATNVGTATGVPKEPPDMTMMFVGTLFGAALLTLIIGTWAKARSAGTGAKIGATVGLLNSFATGLMMYGMTNISNLTATLVDPFVAVVHGAIVGAVIAVVVGKLGGSAA